MTTTINYSTAEKVFTRTFKESFYSDRDAILHLLRDHDFIVDHGLYIDIKKIHSFFADSSIPFQEAVKKATTFDFIFNILKK